MNHKIVRALIGNSRSTSCVGYLAIGVGSLLVISGITYLAWVHISTNRLGKLEYNVPPSVRESWIRPVPLDSMTQLSENSKAMATHHAGKAIQTVYEPEKQSDASGSSTDLDPLPIFNFSSVYPASETNPKFWGNLSLAGTGPYGGPGLPDGFEFVSTLDIFRPMSGLDTANRISIPAIDVEAKVNELEIIDLVDSRSYETPDRVVGHIPSTSNPGESGNGWFFGHLESPLRGEGNVFRRLPEIEELIREDPVDIIIENNTSGFIYRVVSTMVVHQDELSLFNSDGAEITLVVCVPTRVYDHRLLVTAELIAKRG